MVFFHLIETFSRWTQIFYGREDSENDAENHKAPSYDPGSHYDQGMFSWIIAVFRIKYAFSPVYVSL